jgi:hypothetical protein
LGLSWRSFSKAASIRARVLTAVAANMSAAEGSFQGRKLLAVPQDHQAKAFKRNYNQHLSEGKQCEG